MNNQQKKAAKRGINGIILLNKPLGISSNLALQKVKRLFNAKKAGHAGSLDPLATGMLIICLGDATKISQFLLNADKRYEFTLQLGEKTSTADKEGEVIETQAYDHVTLKQAQQVLAQFIGHISQVPPMFSALKVNGQPLYKLARAGKTIEREARQVEIFDLQITEIKLPHITFSVHCSKGTYVRVLAEDIATALDCCGHVAALYRPTTGPFTAEQMLTLEQLQSFHDNGGNKALDQQLLALDSAVMNCPQVTINQMMLNYMRRGQPIFVPQAATDGWVRLYLKSGQFVGMGEVMDDGKIAPKKLFAA